MVISTAAHSLSLPGEAVTIASRLQRALSPERIYLFGSHARGDAGPDSDLDFLVIVRESSDPRYIRAINARQLVSDIPFPKDIIVLTHSEWAAEQHIICSLASTVLREGICLYG